MRKVILLTTLILIATHAKSQLDAQNLLYLNHSSTLSNASYISSSGSHGNQPSMLFHLPYVGTAGDAIFEWDADDSGTRSAVYQFKASSDKIFEFKGWNDGKNSELWFGDENNDKFVIADNGNTGIGTTSPATKLHIKGGASSFPQLRLHENGGTNSVDFGHDGTNTVLRTNEGNILIEGGNVGIGTTSPEANLQVNGNLSLLRGSERLLWGSKHEGTTDHRNYLAPRSADNTAWDWGQEFGYHHYNRAWYFDGNVGIGTNGPNSKLEVRASLATDDQFETVAKIVGYRGSSNSQKPMLTFATQRGSNSAIDVGAIAAYYEGSSEGGLQLLTKENGNLNPQMTIDKSGNVGIGTDSPDAKLAVKGKIHSQEVKVDLNGAVAPDYVFEKEYELRTLEETEEYIVANKHLPEIPSAFEMEENGLELKDMNLKLLQKIEELTLYLIEQNKRLEAAEREIAVLKGNK